MRTNTGPNPQTRELVRQRAGDCCELCGLWAVAGQIHHRRPRQMGGTLDPAINRLSNLVLLCAMCHSWVETARRGPAYRYGWLVPAGIDPAAHPFLLLGRWVLLTDAGRYEPTPAPVPEDERESF